MTLKILALEKSIPLWSQTGSVFVNIHKPKGEDTLSVRDPRFYIDIASAFLTLLFNSCVLSGELER